MENVKIRIYTELKPRVLNHDPIYPKSCFCREYNVPKEAYDKIVKDTSLSILKSIRKEYHECSNMMDIMNFFGYAVHRKIEELENK